MRVAIELLIFFACILISARRRRNRPRDHRGQTTKIGKYLLNHSFMRPGIVSTLTALLMAFVLSRGVLG